MFTTKLVYLEMKQIKEKQVEASTKGKECKLMK